MKHVAFKDCPVCQSPRVQKRVRKIMEEAFDFENNDVKDDVSVLVTSVKAGDYLAREHKKAGIKTG